MTADINEIPSSTPDLQTELAQRLQDLAPGTAEGSLVTSGF